ncbi:MAG: GntR family transcriptional regulator [bacterium]|nr:GntR family transcriptional regulator [bacterium]
MDDIYLVILERLGSGSFPLGSRLPSCRALARDLGSNPSTVSRALRRLAANGLVRTEERRGTFVTATQPARVDSESQIVEDLTRVVSRASAAGYDRSVIGRMFEKALASATTSARVAFAECNVFDLARMSRMVENATGVAVESLLVDDLAEDWRDKFDVVAVPLFHLADVAAKLRGLSRVVELNFVPAAPVLRRIATLDPERRVVVVLPTRRGIERISSLVRQYYAGSIETHIGGADDIPQLGMEDVLVTTHALGLSDDQAASPAEVIRVDWALDQHSARTFKLRVEQAMA